VREEKEMLVIDKLARITGKTFASVYKWPYMLHEDLRLAECAMRNKNPIGYKLTAQDK
jgi:hypothetical protein